MAEPIEIEIDLTEDLTFEKGLGWVNDDGRITQFGYSRWKTRGGFPVMVPDQWEDKEVETAPLPQEIIRNKRYIRIGLPANLPGADIGMSEKKIILPGQED